jgi:uncharacterized protein YraI
MRKVIPFLLLLAALLVGTAPAVGQGGTAWTAQFFNNAILLEPVVLTRQDYTIAFNWGGGSPAPNVNADEFSARWGTDVFLPAGTYRFWALADDSVRIIVDFQFNAVIDTFSQPQQVGQLVSADIALNSGMHHIQVDYRELTGSAYVYLTFANLATNPTGPNFPVPTPPPPIIGGSWTAQYFANASLAGLPTLIQSEASPSHQWSSGSPVASIPADNFSARWTSTQNLAAGTYRITVRADDGVRVFVDSVAVINQWQSATGQTFTADTSLSAGPHNFMIEYFEAGGQAFLEYDFAPLSAVIPPTPVAPPAGGSWQCAYYNNTNIIGFPAVVLVEGSPTHNWGTGAPAAGLPADNFSMRCTSTQILEGGMYRITALADDGVRVIVDGRPVISEWHSASGTPYLASLDLAAGTHNFEVEYYEAGGTAFLTYSVDRAGGVSAPVNTGATLTVRASRLNVRDQPNANTGAVNARVNRGETYPIVGRTADSRWWQINVNGTLGWVYAPLTEASNTGNVPVTSTADRDVTPTGITVTANTAINIRSLPSTRGALYGVMPRGATAELVGRSGDNEWFQIRHNNIVGWVNSRLVALPPGANLGAVPVSG